MERLDCSLQRKSLESRSRMELAFTWTWTLHGPRSRPVPCRACGSLFFSQLLRKHRRLVLQLSTCPQRRGGESWQDSLVRARRPPYAYQPFSLA